MPPRRQLTKPGTRRLSETARKVVAPVGVTSTGWPAIRATCVEKLGITFDDWQEGAGRLIFAKRANGSLAAMVDGVGMSLPRQMGKTFLVGASVFALCVNTPGLLVIWSAHHARTHGETFLAMQMFAKRQRVQPYVRQVFTGSGDEEIRFLNGSRILFGARERGFGRGIPGVDVLIFDEAQILSDKALANMLPTMNTSHLGLALFVGTPPKPDDMAEAFTRMRDDAYAGRLSDGVWIEFGADPDADPGDRAQWAKANPSYPVRTPAQSILRLKRKLTAENFMREGLGVWGAKASSRPIEPAAWAALALELPERPAGTPVFAVDVAPDSSSAAIAAAVELDGQPFLSLAEHRAGSEWLVDRCAELRATYPGARFAALASGAASTLFEGLSAAGVPVEPVANVDYGRACVLLRRLVAERAVRHQPSSAVAYALSNATARDVGDDLWAWSRRRSRAVDLSPLVSFTVAAWVLTTVPTSEVWGFFS